MRKKTFKIFIGSFLFSLFVIWVTNELFVVPQREASELSIPEKNVALFFQQESPMVNYMSSIPVESFSLTNLAPKATGRELMIDEGLFVFDESEDTGTKISSIEDVADIPLEQIEPQKTEPSDDKSYEISDSQFRNDLLPLNKIVNSNAVLQDSSQNPQKAQEEQTVLAINLTSENLAAQKDKNTSVDNFRADENIQIPLEFGNVEGSEYVEIAEKAPQNQIAMADSNNINIDTVAVEQQSLPSIPSSREWYEMSEQNEEDSPWVVAKGTRNPKNNYVLDEDFYKGMDESEILEALTNPKTVAEDEKQVQVAEMVKNILIPIPDDILNDKNLTPQLVSPKKNKKLSNKKNSNTENGEESSVQEEKESGGILKSLTSIFSSSEDETEDQTENEEEEHSHKKSRGLFSAFGSKKSSSKILPAEMRLSFQPGRAEISGTTLRWIQAFANKVIEDQSVILEIRIDSTSSFELQQKRLNLLHNILTNKGVEYGRINTVFTSREPNSFIIRTLRVNKNVDNTVQENKRNQKLYYQSW